MESDFNRIYDISDKYNNFGYPSEVINNLKQRINNINSIINMNFGLKNLLLLIFSTENKDNPILYRCELTDFSITFGGNRFLGLNSSFGLTLILKVFTDIMNYYIFFCFTYSITEYILCLFDFYFYIIFNNEFLNKYLLTNMKYN